MFKVNTVPNIYKSAMVPGMNLPSRQKMCLCGIERSGKDIELELSGRLSAHMRKKKKKKKK